jgi:flavin reductase (DIM6/NTAB) family NADH-FMN oxidoreductase RutF
MEQLLTSQLDSPLMVVTTTNGRERAGCIVGLSSQSSVHPGRYCIWLSKANHTCRVGVHAERFAVHFLTDRDHDTARLFGTLSGDDVDKLDLSAWREGHGGVPVLDACPNHLVARRILTIDDTSDHVGIILEPIAVATAGPFTPLRHSHVEDLQAGRHAEDRPTPASVRDS